MICQKNVKRKQEKLLPLLAFAASLFVLAFAFGAAPVYAPPPQPDRPIDPGGGPIPSTIEGTIIDRSTGTGVPGMVVYLYVTRFYTMTTTTNSEGVFHFQDIGIQWYSDYVVTVNGEESRLGDSLYNVHYGQMRVIAHTDSIGYANLLLRLQPAVVVNSPAAAIYSNTPYTDQVAYFAGSSHDLGFRFLIGSTGFLTSHSWTVGFVWGVYGQHTAQFGRRYYAVGVYDQTIPNPTIVTAGLSAPVDPNEWFRTMEVPEYLSPDLGQPNYGLPTDVSAYSFVMSENEFAEFLYTETSSFTWSVGYSGSVGIRYNPWGINVDIEVTATDTSGSTNTISFKVGPLPEGIHNHKFVVYTRGSSLAMPNNNRYDPANRGGRELHIWDMGEVT